ncbi:MAG: sensor histidine kinase, partial [Butyrivibrio sp.]|nr:sensor histidine kinase [Butyrivibrio sp.]
EDLVEASKISSGNISIELSRINFVELVNQTIGEFYEKLEKNSLSVIFKPKQQDMMIMADARHLWRVIENLLNNVCKYALSGTRVYLDMVYEENENANDKVVFSIKNISASELNIDATELTERFIRGDVSRTTEGSGLGLSIAKNLTAAQGGDFDIRLDGDLFKVIIKFDAAK